MDIDPSILNSIPPKWLVYVNGAMVLYLFLRPVIHAIVNSGGVMGVWNALLYGKTVPNKNGNGGSANPPGPQTKPGQ